MNKLSNTPRPVAVGDSWGPAAVARHLAASSAAAPAQVATPKPAAAPRPGVIFGTGHYPPAVARHVKR